MVSRLCTYAIRSPNPFAGAAVALAALTTISTWPDMRHGRANLDELEPYLHRTLVDQHTVELLESVLSATRFAEDDGSNTTADAIWSVSEHSSLDRSNRFAEVFL